jgi:hypothetical protein
MFHDLMLLKLQVMHGQHTEMLFHSHWAGADIVPINGLRLDLLRAPEPPLLPGLALCTAVPSGGLGSPLPRSCRCKAGIRPAGLRVHAPIASVLRQRPLTPAYPAPIHAYRGG